MKSTVSFLICFTFDKSNFSIKIYIFCTGSQELAVGVTSSYVQGKGRSNFQFI